MLFTFSLAIVIFRSTLLFPPFNDSLMKKAFSLLHVVGIVFLVTQASTSAHAYSPFKDLPSPVKCEDPTGAPIDGGASLLLAGGAAYAVRRIRNRK
jgi:hypothetical protein